MLERISTGVASFTLKNRFKRQGTVNTTETLILGKYLKYFLCLNTAMSYEEL